MRAPLLRLPLDSRTGRGSTRALTAPLDLADPAGLNEVALGISVPKMWAGERQLGILACITRQEAARSTPCPSPRAPFATGGAVPTAGLMARIIGLGPAEKLLQFAVMLSPAEAKDVGLIDDVAPRDGLLVRPVPAA